MGVVDDRLQDLVYQVSKVDSKPIVLEADVEVDRNVLDDFKSKCMSLSSAN